MPIELLTEDSFKPRKPKPNRPQTDTDRVRRNGQLYAEGLNFPEKQTKIFGRRRINAYFCPRICAPQARPNKSTEPHRLHVAPLANAEEVDARPRRSANQNRNE